MDVVVDASSLAAILFDEPAGPVTAERLAGCNLIAPSLLPYELANIARRKSLAEPDRATEIAAQIRGYNGFAIQERRCSQSAVMALALEIGLSAYDASYLLLATQLGAELITLDWELERAWVTKIGA